jgi:hypothetical protein
MTKTCQNCKSSLAYWEAIDCNGYYLCPACYEDVVRHRAWYHDWTGELSIDPESDLCWLCDDCARDLGGLIGRACEDDLNISPCWRCKK